MSSVEGLGARSRHAVKQPTLAEGTSKTTSVPDVVYMVTIGVSASISVCGAKNAGNMVICQKDVLKTCP